MIFFLFVKTSIVQKNGTDFNNKNHTCDSRQPITNYNGGDRSSDSPYVMPQCQDWCLIFSSNMVLLYKVVIGHVSRCNEVGIHELFINCDHAELVVVPYKRIGAGACWMSEYIKYIHNYNWMVDVPSQGWQPKADFRTF